MADTFKAGHPEDYDAMQCSLSSKHQLGFWLVPFDAENVDAAWSRATAAFDAGELTGVHFLRLKQLGPKKSAIQFYCTFAQIGESASNSLMGQGIFESIGRNIIERLGRKRQVCDERNLFVDFKTSETSRGLYKVKAY